MHKKDFIDNVAEKCRFTKGDVRTILDQFFEEVKIACEELPIDGKFLITNFALFRAIKTKPKYVPHPETGEKVFVPSRKSIRIRPSTDYISFPLEEGKDETING